MGIGLSLLNLRLWLPDFRFIYYNFFLAFSTIINIRIKLNNKGITMKIGVPLTHIVRNAMIKLCTRSGNKQG